MKKVLFYIFIALILLATGAWGFIYTYNKGTEEDQAVNYYHLAPDEIQKIQDGDICLRHGFGLVSDLIVEQLDENYDLSHCAILCKDSTGKIYVIHSVSSSISPYDGVQKQELEPFIRDSWKNSVVIVRYKGKGTKKGTNAGIARRAKEYLKKQIPFDNSFDINDSSSFYCTELLWKCILNEYGDDILMDHYNKRKDHMRFDTFLDTSRFEIIINHQERKNNDHLALEKLHSRFLRNQRPVIVADSIRK